MEKLYYESNKYNERYPCNECKSTNCFTRIFFKLTEKEVDSCYLCFSCSEDYCQKKGYQLLTVDYNFEKQQNSQ